MSSKAPLHDSAEAILARWPFHTLWIVVVALTRWRSACLFSRSAWASETVLVALETLAGLHEVLAKGLPACPLRLTFRGRLELPVKVENMAERGWRGRCLDGGWQAKGHDSVGLRAGAAGGWTSRDVDW